MALISEPQFSNIIKPGIFKVFVNYFNDLPRESLVGTMYRMEQSERAQEDYLEVEDIGNMPVFTGDLTYVDFKEGKKKTLIRMNMPWGLNFNAGCSTMIFIRSLNSSSVIWELLHDTVWRLMPSGRSSTPLIRLTRCLTDFLFAAPPMRLSAQRLHNPTAERLLFLTLRWMLLWWRCAGYGFERSRDFHNVSR